MRDSKGRFIKEHAKMHYNNGDYPAMDRTKR